MSFSSGTDFKDRDINSRLHKEYLKLKVIVIICSFKVNQTIEVRKAIRKEANKQEVHNGSSKYETLTEVVMH